MPQTVEEYIDGFGPEVAARLRQVREVVVAEVGRSLGHEPEERLRYGIAGVMLDGRAAFHYAGWKHHIGLYPVPVLSPGLEAEVAPLRAARDTVKLVHARPLPLELVRRVTAEVAQRYTAG